MDGISLSMPLFLVGIGLLVYGWLRLRADQFHSLAFGVSLLAGFFTAGVVWRLDRLAPLAMPARLPRRSSRQLLPLAPFAAYVVFATLVYSLFWDIPPHVSRAYGDLRSVVQLFNFAGMAVCTIAVSRSFFHRDSVLGLAQVLWWITAINALVVVYQYAVLKLGVLPQIGISRSYNEGVQIAAFSHGELDIFRPGALAGEPKALASIMVLYIVIWSSGVDFGNRGLINPRNSRRLAIGALVIVLLTFSTTALVTLVAAGVGVHLANSGVRNLRIRLRRFTAVIFFVAVSVLGVVLWFPAGEGINLLTERYVGRVVGFTEVQTGLDQIALLAWSESLPRVIFGTGMGGISFQMMPHIDPTWALAYAPNIGIVTVLCDVGILGLSLLLAPLVLLVRRARARQRQRPEPARMAAMSIGLCLCILWLVGSGPSLGIGFGLGLLAAAASRFSFSGSRSATAQRSHVGQPNGGLSPELQGKAG